MQAARRGIDARSTEAIPEIPECKKQPESDIRSISTHDKTLADKYARSRPPRAVIT